jgi:hypothetical protein
MMVFTSWKVAGFHVHNSPSFGQTRLVYM